jgi:GH24 family phage-related lysozyme (muramidase)
LVEERVMASNADILAIAIPEIEREEGCAEVRPDGVHAYPDPIHGWDVPTIGFGSTGPNIGRETVWTMDQCKGAIATRLPLMLLYFDTEITWWRAMDAARAAVLVSMGYNLGQGFVHTWPHLMAACREQDWPAAHEAMLMPPTWLNEVHSRATMLAEQMQTGVVA